jgi:tetratricopeptide (TPR) repeat protein
MFQLIYMHPTVRNLIAWAAFLLVAAPCFAQATQDDLTDHLQKAQAYLREKRPDLAIPELQAVVALDPSNIDAQANLGVLLFFQGKYADAIPHLGAAVDKQPDLAKIRGLLGIAEARTGNLTAARKDLEASFPLIQDPHFKIQTGLELVGLYTSSNDLTQAAAILAQLEKSAPDNAEVLYAAYRTYSDLAVQSMLSLSLAAPSSAQMHQMLAHEETKRGDTNAAIAQYRQAIAIDPHLPGVHFELAELLNSSQDAAIKKQAEQEYRAALAANPSDEKAELRLGEIDARNGRVAQALDELTKAVALRPDDADAKFDLAKLLLQMGQNDKAQALLEQAVQLDPTIAVAHLRLAELYRREGRTDDTKREVNLYKQYTDMKTKLTASYKELQVQPSEIHLNDDEKDEK